MTPINLNEMYRETHQFIDEYRQGAHHTFDEYNYFINQLRNSASIAAFFELFEKDTEFDRNEFKRTVIAVEEKVEKLMAHRYLKGEKHWVDSRMAPGYPMVEREIKALGVESGGWMYFVGAGALPFTAMLCHDICGARVVCIDRDGEALELAHAAVSQRYGAEECQRHFAFILASAESLVIPDKKIRHMILAGHCSAKEAILNGLAASLTSDCRILVRLPLGVYQYVYDAIDLGRCPSYVKEADRKSVV